jgi:hypothetical protein
MYVKPKNRRKFQKESDGLAIIYNNKGEYINIPIEYHDLYPLRISKFEPNEHTNYQFHETGILILKRGHFQITSLPMIHWLICLILGDFKVFI